ncbi:Maf family protein [Massiliimalia timonensis]|uniref:Maf family protein n=1 Tax=Massiliimalia timonensis TaxID=1987501 RepID=UPI001E5C4E14|nr:Maf family protein [Massiliimalia timonensis]
MISKMVILASQSPRRKELLQMIVPKFSIEPSHFEEKAVQERIPERLVRLLAEGKAKTVWEKHPEDLVIGCDTIVLSPDHEVFGIPENREEAKRMLLSLSGRTHRVITGVCVMRRGKKSVFHQTTKVTFQMLTDSEIEAYLDTGEPFDKAGAYGIQGYAGALVERINGDYYSVVGLPVAKLRKVLQKF